MSSQKASPDRTPVQPEFGLFVRLITWLFGAFPSNSAAALSFRCSSVKWAKSVDLLRAQANATDSITRLLGHTRNERDFRRTVHLTRPRFICSRLCTLSAVNQLRDHSSQVIYSLERHAWQ
jgi:hypothetical protein